jgi:hypothetical protein
LPSTSQLEHPRVEPCRPRWRRRRTLGARDFNQRLWSSDLSRKAALEKDDPNWIASLGHAYAVTAIKRGVLKILDELKTLAKQSDLSPYQLAVVYVGLGEKDRAFELLEKAKVERSTLLKYLKMDPRFDSLRSDPRFQDLLRGTGLSDSSRNKWGCHRSGMDSIRADRFDCVAPSVVAQRLGQYKAAPASEQSDGKH